MEGTIRIKDIFSIIGIGVVPVGEVINGTIQIGMQTIINGKTVTVKTIEAHHEQLQEASAGMEIGFSLIGVTKKDLTKGMQITFTDGAPKETAQKPEPIRPKGFLSNLFRR